MTRSSKPTELYEYSPTKKALCRLSEKFKKLTFKDTQKHKGFSSSYSMLSSEPDKEIEDSVFPSPKAESYELGLGAEKSKIDVLYADIKPAVDTVDTVADTVTLPSLPFTLPSAPSPAHSVAHEEVSDTTHALGDVVLPVDSVTHEASDTTHAIGGAPVTSIFDTGFTTATVAISYAVPSYVTTLTTATTSPSTILTSASISVAFPVAVTTVKTSPIVTGTATVTTVSTVATPIVSVDLGTGLGAGPSGSISVLYTCLLYTSPSPRDRQKSRMPSSA